MHPTFTVVTAPPLCEYVWSPLRDLEQKQRIYRFTASDDFVQHYVVYWTLSSTDDSESFCVLSDGVYTTIAQFDLVNVSWPGSSIV